MISDGTYLLFTLAGATAAAWVADKAAALAVANPTAFMGAGGQELVLRAVLTPAWDPAGQPP